KGVVERLARHDILHQIAGDGLLELRVKLLPWANSVQDRLPPTTDSQGRREHSLRGARLRSKTCWIPWVFLVRVGSRWHRDLSHPRSDRRVLTKFRNVSEPGCG